MIVTCFYRLIFLPSFLVIDLPVIISLSVCCEALLKRLSFPHVVLISNKRGCKTQGYTTWHCHLVLSLCAFYVYLSHLHLQIIAWLFLHPAYINSSFLRVSYFSVHPAALACTLAPMLAQPPTLLTHMAARLTLIVRSQHQGTVHLARLGGRDGNVCVFTSVYVRPKGSEMQ